MRRSRLAAMGSEPGTPCDAIGRAWVHPAKGGATMMGRLIRVLALVSAGVLGLSACGTAGTSGKLGGTVHVLGTWSGAEKESFDVVVKPFTDKTGVRSSFEVSWGLAAANAVTYPAGTRHVRA